MLKEKEKGSYQLQESLCHLINRASRTIRTYFNKALLKKGHRITGEQFEVLVLLWNQDGNNQQALSITLGKDKTTVTRLIRSLEKAGLAKRVKNIKDERQKLVYLTHAGREIMKELNGIAQKITAKAEEGISQEDIALCKLVLKRVHETLSNELY